MSTVFDPPFVGEENLCLILDLIPDSLRLTLLVSAGSVSGGNDLGEGIISPPVGSLLANWLAQGNTMINPIFSIGALTAGHAPIGTLGYFITPTIPQHMVIRLVLGTATYTCMIW